MPYFQHNELDIYDPNHVTLGNTNLKCDNGVLKPKDNFGRIGVSSGN